MTMAAGTRVFSVRVQTDREAVGPLWPQAALAKNRAKRMAPLKRVLLIEDHAAIRHVLARLLSRQGYQVTTAADGESGLAMASLEKPDIILMDLQLPQMDGWETTRLLQQHPETRDIPIIAVSAHCNGLRRSTALEMGFSETANKPVHLGQLIEKMHAVWSHRVHAAPPAKPVHDDNSPCV